MENKIFLYSGVVQFFIDGEEMLGKVSGYIFSENFSDAAAVIERDYKEDGYEIFHLELTDCPPDLFYENKGGLLQ